MILATLVAPRFDRREQLIEVSVFLLLIVPSMVLGLFVVRQGGLSFAIVAWATVLRDLGLAGLVCFLAWRNGEPVERICWSWIIGHGKGVSATVRWMICIRWWAFH